MLSVCCKYGTVRAIQLITLPGTYISTVLKLLLLQLQTSGSGSGSGSGTTSATSLPILRDVVSGAVAVTFESECLEGVHKCASTLRGRRFDGRPLITYVLQQRQQSGTPNTNSNGNMQVTASNIYTVSNILPVVTTLVPPPPPPPPPPRPPAVPKPAAMLSTITTNVNTSNVSSGSGTTSSEPVAHNSPNTEVPADADLANVDDFLNSLL